MARPSTPSKLSGPAGAANGRDRQTVRLATTDGPDLNGPELAVARPSRPVRVHLQSAAGRAPERVAGGGIQPERVGRSRAAPGISEQLRKQQASQVRSDEQRGISAMAAKQVRAPQLLTVSDVAERLRISVKTVRRQVDQGELRVHRIGRQLRVSEQDLEAFIKVWRS